MSNAWLQADTLVYATNPAGLRDVEALMTARVSSSHRDPLSAWFGSFVETGGKRLRARLALASAACFGEARARAVPWAAAVELMHNATLVHDDIQDGDRVRRGQPSSWVKHGVAQAINIGDFGLMLPYAVVGDMNESTDIRCALMKVLAHQGIRAARGQRGMLGLLTERRLTREDYVDSVAGTTGSFFSLPVQGSAILAGFDEAEARLIGDAFLPLGLLFQLQDDILDLYGDSGRNGNGSDLRDGKVSGLVVAHLDRRPTDADWLIELLETPRDQTSDAEVLRAIASFKRSGALADSLAEIERIRRGVESCPVMTAHPALAAMASEFVTLALHPLQDIEG